MPLGADPEAGGGADANVGSPAPPPVARPLKGKLRLALLLVGLAAASAGGVFLRWDDIREWRLRGVSDSELARRAARHDADVLTRLAHAERLIAGGRNADAIPVLGEAVNLLPPNPSGTVAQRVYSRFGHALALAGYGDDAGKFLDAARRLDSDDPRVYLGYALVLISQKMYEGAQKQVKVAVTLDPESAEAWYLTGKLLNDTGKPEAAIEPLSKSVGLAPKFAAAHAELGHCYAYQAQFAKATDAFRQAVACEPGNGAHRQALGAALAMGARSRDQYEEARDLIEESVKNGNANPQLVYTLALLHVRFNALDDAKQRLLESLKNEPDNAEAWYNLGLVEKRLGNDAVAASATRKFQELSKVHDAQVVAEKKVAADLDNVEHRLTLARAYRRGGNTVGAYWQMRVALQIKPNQPEIVKELRPIAQDYGKIRARMGNTPDDPKKMGPPPPDALRSLPPGAGSAAGKSPESPAAP
ncbi:MAG: tetratricopeptide repeat protein [Armatimonadota bacterium]